MVERHTIVDKVTFNRGFGESGRRLNLLKDADCGFCGYDRQLEHVRVSPEQEDVCTLKCMHPNCPEYHDNEWSHMTGGI